MKDVIDKKRKDLISDVENNFNKFISVISDDGICNTSYAGYTDAFNKIKDSADKVLKFNEMVNVFFSA